MTRCPDDGGPLSPTARGLACRACGGAALEPAELEALSPSIAASLRLETDERSGAFALRRRCPRCEAAMAPWRLSERRLWIERCPSCELLWLDRNDLLLLRTYGPAQPARPPSPSAPAAADEPGVGGLSGLTGDLHPLQAVLAWFGFPVVIETEGDHPPIVTVTLCLVLLATFGVWAATDAPGLSPDDLAYEVGVSGVLGAITANLMHADWLHLLGNLYFLFTFGGAIEQKTPRWVMLAAFLGLGPLTLLIDGALAPQGLLLVGASGAIAVLMGMAFVLQRGARVFTPLSMVLSPLASVYFFSLRFRADQPLVPPGLRVPLWAWGAFELLSQVVMLALGVPGVAWAAHASGLVLGIGLGLLSKRVWPHNPRLRDPPRTQ